MSGIRYTEEERAWLKANIPGNSYKDIARMFSERFRPVTVNQIHNYCKNHRIPTGRLGYFPKGNVPFVKGKPLAEWMSPEGIKNSSRTRFKKGQDAHNRAQIGAERNIVGYIEVKVAQPNVWKLKHRLIWERAHGPIPENYFVRFRDGDPLNMDLENLTLVHKDTHLAMSRLKISSPPPEMFDTAVLIAKLDVETGKKKRQLGKKNDD